jgi:hypothetical protein
MDLSRGLGDVYKRQVETPSQGAAVAKPSLPFNFKPLPKGLMPVAPNSVFDLSKFMNLATA